MKNFILKDEFTDIIDKNKNKLRDFYEKEKDKLFFHNDVTYGKDYNLCLIDAKQKKENLEELKKTNEFFIDIFKQNNDLIIPFFVIGKICGYPNKDWFISHRHNFITDGNIYHYILNCNDSSGMIMGNEYLHFKKDMIFGFNGNKNHIVFNFGETVKESYIFFTLNKKSTLEDWTNEFKDYFIDNKKYMIEMNKKYARSKIKKITGF